MRAFSTRDFCHVRGDDWLFEPLVDHLINEARSVVQLRRDRFDYIFALNVLACGRTGFALTRRPYPRLHVARHRCTEYACNDSRLSDP